MYLTRLSALRHLLPLRIRVILRHRWNHLLQREHQIHERRFYRQFIRPGDLVFDVGANVGEKTTVFLRLGARVVALEPNRECIERLHSKFVEALRFGHLTVLCVAAGCREDIIKFHVLKNASTLSTGSEEFIRLLPNYDNLQACVIEIPTITLDSVIEQFGKPTFIKIDAEGMDALILAGLHFRPRYLSFEFNTNPALWAITQQCFVEAERLGFSHANITFGDVSKLYFPDWLEISKAPVAIQRVSGAHPQFGDVIVQ